MSPMGETRIVDTLLANSVIGSVAIKKAIDHDEVDSLLPEFRLLLEQLVG
jgi:hypothetical protein